MPLFATQAVKGTQWGLGNVPIMMRRKNVRRMASVHLNSLKLRIKHNKIVPSAIS